MSDTTGFSTQLPEELGAALLFHIIQVACLGNERDLATIGITREDAAFLARLTVQQQLYLQKRLCLFARLCVEMDILRHISNRAREFIEEEELQDALIQLDATQPLMNELFGMGSVEYRRRARRLGHTIQRGRRPTLLSAEQERRVRQAWFKDYRDLPVPERYVRVAHEIGVSVAAITAAIAIDDKVPVPAIGGPRDARPAAKAAPSRSAS